MECRSQPQELLGPVYFVEQQDFVLRRPGEEAEEEEQQLFELLVEGCTVLAKQLEQCRLGWEAEEER